MGVAHDQRLGRAMIGQKAVSEGRHQGRHFAHISTLTSFPFKGKGELGIDLLEFKDEARTFSWARIVNRIAKAGVFFALLLAFSSGIFHRHQHGDGLEQRTESCQFCQTAIVPTEAPSSALPVPPAPFDVGFQPQDPTACLAVLFTGSPRAPPSLPS
jgi:hypothetical protein